MHKLCIIITRLYSVLSQPVSLSIATVSHCPTCILYRLCLRVDSIIIYYMYLSICPPSTLSLSRAPMRPLLPPVSNNRQRGRRRDVQKSQTTSTLSTPLTMTLVALRRTRLMEAILMMRTRTVSLNSVSQRRPSVVSLFSSTCYSFCLFVL